MKTYEFSNLHNRNLRYHDAGDYIVSEWLGPNARKIIINETEEFSIIR
jgi:hypothetical protein